MANNDKRTQTIQTQQSRQNQPSQNQPKSSAGNPFNANAADSNEKLRHQAYEAAYQNNKPGAIKFPGAEKRRQDTSTTQAKTFVERRDSFIASNDLPLNKHYNKERDRANHPYPGRQGHNQQVEYIDRNTQQRQNYAVNLQQGQLQQQGIKSTHHDNTVDPSKLGDNKVMFTRRGSNADQLLAMVKEKQSPDKQNKRTQHSTFNSGLPVANAGYLNFGTNNELRSVTMLSGHYQPNQTSAVKMAMWADKHQAFGSSTQIKDLQGNQIDTSMSERVKAVNKWAKAHPKPNK